ncbi:unnamed protein product [Adineta steineri]|uniref:CBM1 domain-containing protein n=1 Tax=Adineta steineri TaxID=433720 RepID=A0A814TK55_9BILA|nr:unnamed protein product [Adineta steineri]
MSIMDIYEQCAGEGYETFPCNPGLTCFRRNKWFSLCQYSCSKTLDWECETYIAPVTTILAGWDRCGDEGWMGMCCPSGTCNNVGNAICPFRYGCFRNSDLYSECRPYCPPTWLCETDVVGLNEQCGDEDYVDVTRCAPGLRCYVRSKWYSHCAASCPGHD